MAAFRKTIGGLDPWSMPSDGVNGEYINLDRRTKKRERRQYSKARRREANQVIAEDSGGCFNDLDT
jgi:hypothetical protein